MLPLIPSMKMINQKNNSLVGFPGITLAFGQLIYFSRVLLFSFLTLRMLLILDS